jgi:hypothetical protein
MRRRAGAAHSGRALAVICSEANGTYLTSVRDKTLNIRLRSVECDSENTKKLCSVSRRPLDMRLLPSVMLRDTPY